MILCVDQRSPVPSFVWQSLNHYTDGVYMEQNRLVVIDSYSSFNLLMFDIYRAFWDHGQRFLNVLKQSLFF